MQQNYNHVLQDESAEEALAHELQEAIAEAHSHQNMAMQQSGPLTRPQVIACHHRLSLCHAGFTVEHL